ncbi:hypothetical protein SEEPB962_07578 [Salmonella enterica subsp. enterica serovar Paratyphi B str. ATCC 51962]|nr:hypothetical protein SEEPB962_07578 [Salmonella enterica subsp. enterica serovar Paratyphi B str. ATCC 51962]
MLRRAPAPVFYGAKLFWFSAAFREGKKVSRYRFELILIVLILCAAIATHFYLS